MSSTLATKTLEPVGFTYDGSFHLAFLLDDEEVRSTGDGTGNCVVSSQRGHTRLRVGDLVTRRKDGLLQSFGPREKGDGSPRTSVAPLLAPSGGTDAASRGVSSPPDLRDAGGRAEQ
jgi:hypothetical protein